MTSLKVTSLIKNEVTFFVVVIIYLQKGLYYLAETFVIEDRGEYT